MNFKPVFFINGILLLILSGFMLFPVLIDLADRSPDWKVFASAQIVTSFIGFALIFTNMEKSFSLSLRQTFILVTMSWIFLTVFAALPFAFANINMSLADAFFEAASGLTTTGSTVISGLNELPRGILLWRAILQGLGGIGFLIVALAVLPLLQISGMQIFKTQSFGMEKVLPSAQQMAFYIIMLYMALIFAAAILFYIFDMGMFDAFCHAMTAVATAGFSNYDNSIGHFNSRAIDIIAIIFMWLGSLPFVLYVRMLKGDSKALVNDSQVTAFFSIVFALASIITLFLVFTGQKSLFDAFINSVFMITTLMTTTGFATEDYSQWGTLAIGMAFLATFLGGCSGSTSGGIKIFRLQILWYMFQQQIRKLILPRGVFHVHYNGKIVEHSIQASVAGFIFVFLLTWLAFSLMLAATGLDFVTALTGAATSISNVGPGLGDIIGPAGNFNTLPDDAIWILSFAMLLGRVELLTFFVLLAPRFWRN